jgi:chromosome segregation ATPase
MHIVFALSAFAMLAATIWMMAHDYDDEWRGIQREGFKLAAQQLEAKERALKTASYEEQEAELKQRITEANEELAQRKSELRPLQAEVDRLEGEMTRATQRVRFKRAERDKARADLDLKVRDGASRQVLQQYQAGFDKAQAIVDELEVAVQNKEAELNQAKAALAVKAKPHDLAVAALKNHQTELARLE